MPDDVAADINSIARIDAVQKILEVICRTTGLGFSAVARVTDTRWIACAVRDEIAFGLTPGGELELETTICNEIRQSHDPVVIDHVAEDPQFCGHPTPKKYGFQSYASFPIVLPDGRFFGTLCAIDPRPAQLNQPQIIEMFRLFAQLIGMHLDVQERMRASEAALLDAHAVARLREQFIAVLGHDLRNPLAAIKSGADLLRMIVPAESEEREMVEVIHRSSNRMSELITNLLDFARGRLGAGLDINSAASTGLIGVLNHVVAELQTAWPHQPILLHLDIDRTFAVDSSRIGQMLSNLLSNALTHGDPSSSVSVDAKTTADTFELSVTNGGKTIPPEILARLFEPFARGSDRVGQQGLGLGLYIATEIAKAHHGKLEVASTDGQTRFTFRMPIAKTQAQVAIST